MSEPIIEWAFEFDSCYDKAKREFVCTCYYLDSLVVEHRQTSEYRLMQATYDKAVQIIKEWDDWLDQISNTELQYRRTITSSCGQLKVTESL